MAGTLKVDSINADSNLTLRIANTAVAFIDATGLRPLAGNLNLDATATSKFYLPSANTVAIQTAGVTAVTVDSSQNTTLAGTLTTTGITNSGVATGARFNPTGSSATGTGMYLPAANSLGFSANGTNAVYIDSSQNVGIGITSPSTYGRFAVNTPTGGNGVLGVNDSVSGGGGAQLSFYYGTFKYNYIDAAVENGTAGSEQSRLMFATSNAGTLAERMRIRSDGALLVGTTIEPTSVYNGFKTDVSYTIISAAGATCLYLNRNTNTGNIVEFRYNNGGVGSISTGGSTTSYNTSSDYRLKENIAPMTGALAKVAQLKPVTYKWKSTGEESQGFIAHELKTVVPDCVTGEKDETEVVDIKDEEGNVIGQETKPKYQGVDTSFLVATLTAAIQELKAIVDAQATRIVALESK